MRETADQDKKRGNTRLSEFLFQYAYSFLILFVFLIFFSIYYSVSKVFPRLGGKFGWTNLSHIVSPLTIRDNEKDPEINLIDEYQSYTLGDSLLFRWRVLAGSEGPKVNFFDIEEIVHGWESPAKIFFFKSWEYHAPLSKAGYDKFYPVGQIKERSDVEELRSIISDSRGAILVLLLNGLSPTNLTADQKEIITKSGFPGFRRVGYGEAYAAILWNQDGRMDVISEVRAPRLVETATKIDRWGEIEVRSSLDVFFADELKDKPSVIRVGHDRTFFPGKGAGLFLLVLPSSGKTPKGYYLNSYTPYYVAEKSTVRGS